MKKIVLLLFVPFMLLSSCKDSNKSEKEIEVEVEGVSAETRAEAEEMERDLRDLRDDINSQIDDLDAEMDDATDEMKEDMKIRRAQLVAWRDRTGKQIETLGDKISDGWSDFVRDTKALLDEVDEDVSDEN